MNHVDSIAPRYYGGDPLAHAPLVNDPAPKRPPLVEYPGRLREAEEVGELRYMPVYRQGLGKKKDDYHAVCWHTLSVLLQSS